MGVHRGRGLGVYHVDETRYALGMDSVLGAAAGHRAHVLAASVKLPEGMLLTGDEPVAVDNMLVGKARSKGRGRADEDIAVGPGEGAHLEGVGDLTWQIVRACEAVR